MSDIYNPDSIPMSRSEELLQDIADGLNTLSSVANSVASSGANNGIYNPASIPMSRGEELLQNIATGVSGVSEHINQIEEELVRLESATVFLGVTTTPLYDGATTNPITIDGQQVTAQNSEYVSYAGKEFIFNGTKWDEYGAPYVELTQAQYDALSTSQKNNGTLYFLTDAASGYTVDSALSSTSENPVQNKVVKGAIDNLAYECVLNGALDKSADTYIGATNDLMMSGDTVDITSTSGTTMNGDLNIVGDTAIVGDFTVNNTSANDTILTKRSSISGENRYTQIQQSYDEILLTSYNNDGTENNKIHITTDDTEINSGGDVVVTANGTITFISDVQSDGEQITMNDYGIKLTNHNDVTVDCGYSESDMVVLSCDNGCHITIGGVYEGGNSYSADGSITMYTKVGNISQTVQSSAANSNYTRTYQTNNGYSIIKYNSSNIPIMLIDMGVNSIDISVRNETTGQPIQTLSINKSTGAITANGVTINSTGIGNFTGLEISGNAVATESYVQNYIASLNANATAY